MTGNPPTVIITPIESEDLASNVKELLPLAEKGLVYLAGVGGEMAEVVDMMANGAITLQTAKENLEQYEREREANNGLTPEQLVRQHLRSIVPFATQRINEMDEAAESDDDQSEADAAGDKLDDVLAYVHNYRHEDPSYQFTEGDIPF